MMLHEFVERTDFEPMPEEYAQIEEAYYNFGGNKDEFCRSFVSNGGEKLIYRARAKKIEELRSKSLEMEKDFMATIRKKEQEIDHLTAALDRELEWKPHELNGNTKQSDYESLRDCSCTRRLSDDEAGDLIAEEFGFDRQKINILHEVDTYEINRHGGLRKTGTVDRTALYNATDWNYIRFNVRGNVTMSYEMHNGELKLFFR